MVTYPHAGFVPGQCEDFNAVSEYLKAWGEFTKDEKKGWNILGVHYPVIEAFKSKFYGDKTFGGMVRQHVVEIMLNQGELLQDGGKA